MLIDCLTLAFATGLTSGYTIVGGGCHGQQEDAEDNLVCGFEKSQVVLLCSEYSDDNPTSPWYYAFVGNDNRCWYLSRHRRSAIEARAACRAIRTKGMCMNMGHLPNMTYDDIEVRARLANMCTKEEVADVVSKVLLPNKFHPNVPLYPYADDPYQLRIRVSAYQYPKTDDPKANWYWGFTNHTVDPNMWKKEQDEPNDISGDERCAYMDEQGLMDTQCETMSLYLCVVDVCSNCEPV